MAVRDDREEPGAWILARVIKYVPETHQYELKDDDDKEGIGMLTAPRSLVIRLEDSTKGVQKGERVLAVFPDTTSFYLGTIHRVRTQVFFVVYGRWVGFGTMLVRRSAPFTG